MMNFYCSEKHDKTNWFDSDGGTRQNKRKLRQGSGSRCRRPVRVRRSMYVCVYVCVCVCVYRVCMYACMHACMHVCVCEIMIGMWGAVALRDCLYTLSRSRAIFFF